MTQPKSVGKVLSYPNNIRLYATKVVQQYTGVEVDYQDVEFAELKSEARLKQFPYGRHPVMETVDGPLYESEAIAYYVAAKGDSEQLLGKTAYDKALIQKFLTIAALDVTANANTWGMMLGGYVPYNKMQFDASVNSLKRPLSVLNTELATRTFLVGERVSFADIWIACLLVKIFQSLLDDNWRQEVPHLTRWFLTCISQPQFKSVVGEVELCVTPAKPEVKKEQKPAKEQKPKEDKPKKEKKAQVDEDAPEDDVPKEEKKKSVLESLPPSPFILDAWKRFYSNNEEAKSVEYFWQNYDPQGWTMWRCEYKYNDELTMVFMSSNLIGGFFNRIERARKWAFGSMCVCGENNNSTISGMWIFRGDQVPEEVTDAADFDSYKFTKVEVTGEMGNVKVSDEVKEAWNCYLQWSGPKLPGKFADGKIFK